jgi:putative colanic acid biosynthesis UDP-glucose lipid carrier transferase
LVFYVLKKYRSIYGGNRRNVIIVGNDEKTIKLFKLFTENLDYGCNILKVFSFEAGKQKAIDESLKFALENNIDVVYCSLKDLKKNELNRFIDFSDDYLKEVKFLPVSDEMFSSNAKIDYYEYIPVISLQKTTLHDPITKVVKRVFDIIFSLLVIVFLLSWLVPILAFLIKMESKGPAFFRQGRPGIDEKEFFCYKFRSMRVNLTTEKEASKNDPRVTNIGRFIRKTSIDEMPQFLNVLRGEMSVVAPRPHLWSQNKSYGNKIKKYMMRHYVKPGITGLAQVKGYRGEIETDEDMINRINYDVYYIENWSVILDIKIIAQTVINIFKGEEKAY